jgi:hypothetical protein
MSNKPGKSKQKKSLLAFTAGKSGLQFVETVLKVFPESFFDVLIFSHDKTFFDIQDYPNCKIILNQTGKQMRKYDFAKHYLQPGSIQSYEYLFLWDDDADLSQFDPVGYLNLIRKAGFEMSMPAYSRGSCYSHPVTLQQKDTQARFTDFVEVSFPVFTTRAWRKFYHFLELYDLPYPDDGGVYDDLTFTMCRIMRQGVVDKYPILHYRPINEWEFKARRIHQLHCQKFHRWPSAQRINLANLGEYDEIALDQLLDEYWMSLFETRSAMLELEYLDKTLGQVVTLGAKGKLPEDEAVSPIEGLEKVRIGPSHVYYQPEAHEYI